MIDYRKRMKQYAQMSALANGVALALKEHPELSLPKDVSEALAKWQAQVDVFQGVVLHPDLEGTLDT